MVTGLVVDKNLTKPQITLLLHMKVVKGGGKLGRWGVEVQDKCPAKCSA